MRLTAPTPSTSPSALTGVAPWVTLAILLAAAQPAQADLNTLRGMIQNQPANSWMKVNLNTFAEVKTPPALIPLYNETSHNDPRFILTAWSGFAWDSARGKLIIYGGGHANYPGNEVYVWNGSNQLWERGSLPSQITAITTDGGYEVVDGAENAPIAAHTYDTTTYLPLADKVAVFGGASWNQGAGYITLQDNGTVRSTGPYFLDPAKLDGDLLGGSTGSGVDISTPGGQMWENRDLPGRVSNYAGSFINASAGYATLNGKDVVFVEKNDLYRYTVNDPADPALDTWEVVGINWGGGYSQGGGAYDPVNNMYVRTYRSTAPFEYWNLESTGYGNRMVLVEPSAVTSDDPAFLMNESFGMDYDTPRQRFVMWDGTSGVWSLKIDKAAGSWTVNKLASEGSSALPSASINGVIGKWKYASDLDVFVALFDNGDVYLYKPEALPDNTAPTVQFVNAPATALEGVATSLEASASDNVGVTSVQFLANGASLCTLTSAPYTCAWTPAATGTANLEVRATDAAGNTASALASVQVNTPPDTTAPTVQFVTVPATATLGVATTLTASASDSVGVTSVQFLANGVSLCNLASAPYTCAWTPAATGTVTLEVRATDAAGNTASAQSSVQVNSPPDTIAPTFTAWSPKNGASAGISTSITLSATAQDNVAVSSITIVYSGRTLCTFTGASGSCQWTTPSRASKVALTYTAKDAAGNKTIKKINLNVR